MRIRSRSELVLSGQKALIPGKSVISAIPNRENNVNFCIVVPRGRAAHHKPAYMRGPVRYRGKTGEIHIRWQKKN